MSGTLRTTASRGAAVVAVIGLLHAVQSAQRRLRREFDVVRRRGGLTVAVAVPVAVSVTAVVVWATTAVAGSWLTR